MSLPDKPVLTRKPDALLGLMDDKSPGMEPVYREKYIRPVGASGTSGTVTLEVTPENSGSNWGIFEDPEPHPSKDEREALRAYRAARKARVKDAKRSRRRNRLRSS